MKGVHFRAQDCGRRPLSGLICEKRPLFRSQIREGRPFPGLRYVRINQFQSSDICVTRTVLRAQVSERTIFYSKRRHVT